MTMCWRPSHGGHFLSKGIGSHPCRTLDSYELIFVHAGTLCIREGDDNYELTAGDFLILRPGVPHGGTRGYKAGLSFFWLHFYVAGEPPPVRCGKLRNPDKVRELFQLYLNNQSEPDAPPQNAALLLEVLLNECFRPPVSDHKHAALVEWAQRIIRLRFHEPDFSASALAEELNVNRDYLSRLFRQDQGIPLSRAIIEVKLDNVRDLLLNTNLSVKEIILDSGFNNISHFHRQFSRKFGCTPHQYRNYHISEYMNLAAQDHIAIEKIALCAPPPEI